ncbi:MAG: phospholipid carrier-dependent glycosyltransferase, partial [Peristeroidobacter soli]
MFAFARRIGYSTESALVSSALLAINPYFALTGQLNLLDQGFSFFLSAALFSFVVAQVEAPQPSRSRGWMVITWAALALAVLSKGIVALVLAGATVVAYLAFTRDFALLRRLNIAAGLPLFLLLAVPWFWLIQQRNPEFFQFFFIREHFERFLTTVHARTGPPWYFVPLVLLALLPLIGNWNRWRLEKIESGRAAGDFRPELFLLLWCAVVVGFFSLSESKLASYILPIMPALAVILGRVTQEDPRAHSRAKWISVGLLVLLGTVLVAIGWYRKTWASGPALAWGSVLVVSCLAYLVFDRLRKDLSTTQRWAALSAVSIVGYQLLAMCYASSFPSRSASGLASEFAGGIPADTDLYSV